MDKNLAARNPKAADRWQAEQTADRLLTPGPGEIVEAAPRPTGREAFLVLANEIREDADRLIEKRNKSMKDLWG